MPSNKNPNETSEVLSHWYAVSEGVQFSSQEFYASIESEIAARKMPRLHASRIEYHEGSIATDKRIYLRFARERYAFDICAAPFGRDYFFSLRLIQKARESWLPLICIAAVFTLFFMFFPRMYVPREYMRQFWGIVGIAMLYSVYLAYVPKSFSPSGLIPDIDGFLLNLPGIGKMYENWRQDTYYRYDTRLLFQTLVAEIVKRKVEEVMQVKGAKLLQAYEYSPILGEMYRRTTVMAETKDTENAIA
ncbi:MAG TPA: hypothetical protein VGM64_20315 [Lacunisphaera sp.]|jgi:hypothetical protein